MELETPISHFSEEVRWEFILILIKRLTFLRRKSQQLLSPICIFPPEANVDDVPRQRDRESDLRYKTYVSGWGTIKGTCQTGDLGPSPTSACKFPFEWQVSPLWHKFSLIKFDSSNKGKTTHSVDGCSREPTPSHKNEICQEFEEWKGTPLLPTDPGVAIRYWRKKQVLTTFCYSSDEGRWVNELLKCEHPMASSYN